MKDKKYLIKAPLKRVNFALILHHIFFLPVCLLWLTGYDERHELLLFVHPAPMALVAADAPEETTFNQSVRPPRDSRVESGANARAANQPTFIHVSRKDIYDSSRRRSFEERHRGAKNLLENFGVHSTRS